MSDAPQLRTQRIIPYLYYRDASAAISFLCEALGFEERYRMTMPDGSMMMTPEGICSNDSLWARSFSPCRVRKR